MAVMMKSAAAQKMAVRPANIRLPMGARPALRPVRATPQEEQKPKEYEIPATGDRIPINLQDEFKSSLPPPVDNKGGVTTSEPATFEQAMGFWGAPEIINGRLAMLGFTAAMAAELATGASVVDQLKKEPAMIFLAFALTIAASLYPVFVRRKNDIVPPFTPGAELINGRAAMVGFAALVAFEAFKGHALF